MKSVCIKLTNQKTAKYLLEQLNNFEIDDVYFSCKKFKIYYNVIIHYKGNNISLFLCHLSSIITLLIISYFEEIIIKNLIKSEYFYFDDIEKKQIFNIVIEDLYNPEESVYSYDDRNKMIYDKIYEYLIVNNSFILKGFINFRIKNYLEALLEQIDKAVSKFIVEKEYTEYISLLRVYINSEKSSCEEIHLIYHNFKSILLDKNKNIINIEDEMHNSKYLSDITFSNNDYVLNALLNIIPKKIIIHLIDENIDEFINTIKLIFEDRVVFCNDCSICRIYKKSGFATCAGRSATARIKET